MKKINKTQKVFKHLKRYGQIDSWTAIKKFRATRLSSIIFNLRSEGYTIETKMKETNEGIKFAKYIYHNDSFKGGRR